MRRAIFILVVAFLSACTRSPTVLQKDVTTMCSLGGESYSVRHGVGDTSFVVRTTDNDALCAALKEKTNG